MPIPHQIAQLKFPVILWRKGYTYVASTPLELCTHPRNLLGETQQRALRGEFSLLDSAGSVHQVNAYQPVAPFGGAMRFAHALLRSAYAAPVLESPSVPSLSEFKATLAGAVRLQVRKQLLLAMQSIDSSSEAVALAVKFDRMASP